MTSLHIDQYDRELDRGYLHFTYRPFYSWLASVCTNIVEVGCWKGFSTAFLASEVKRLHVSGHVFAVDVWDGCGGGWSDFQTRFPDDTGTHLFNCFRRMLDRWDVADVVTPMRMTSTDAARRFMETRRQFDAVFLDDDHSYDAVKDGIVNWNPLVRSGGILAGHDYNNKEVRAAVDELIADVRSASGHVWYTIL